MVLSGDGTVIFGNKLFGGRREKQILCLCPLFASDHMHAQAAKVGGAVLFPVLTVGGQDCLRTLFYLS